jgi:hypothetical protein
MCSEGLFWRCHHRLVSDDLLARGIVVYHIMPDGELRPHTLTEGARAEGGELSYPSPPEEATLPLLGRLAGQGDDERAPPDEEDPSRER